MARVSGVPYERYVRDEIFGPLGMDDCWVGMPVDRYEAYGDRIGQMHVTSSGEAVRLTGHRLRPRDGRADAGRERARPDESALPALRHVGRPG